MVGVASKVWAAWWGSWMAKWSMEEVDGCETGLKEGGRCGVKHVNCCRLVCRMRPLVERVSQCA